MILTSIQYDVNTDFIAFHGSNEFDSILNMIISKDMWYFDQIKVSKDKDI